MTHRFEMHVPEDIMDYAPDDVSFDVASTTYAEAFTDGLNGLERFEFVEAPEMQDIYDWGHEEGLRQSRMLNELMQRPQNEDSLDEAAMPKGAPPPELAAMMMAQDAYDMVRSLATHLMWLTVAVIILGVTVVWHLLVG